MKIRPTIAVLTPTPTHPEDHGNRKRLCQICEGISASGARIELIYYPLENDWRGRCPEDSLQAMRDRWDDFHMVLPSIPIHSGAKGVDHEIDEWWDPALSVFLEWYFSSRFVDALVVNYVYLSKAFEFAPTGCLKILDTHDVFADRRLRLAESGIAPEFFHTTRADEDHGLNRSDIILAIKEEEEEEFKRRVDRKVITMPYVEPSRELAQRERDAQSDVIFGFIGARNNFNVSNLKRFLEAALPLWERYMAPLKLVVAGSVCTDLQEYQNHPMVELIGFVESVEEFYSEVDVALVPMEISTGQKIKTGEALGYGIPIISHAHAFEGYVPQHPWHRCRSMSEIARACIDVAFEPEKLAALANATIGSQFDQTRKFDQAMDDLLSEIDTGKPTEVFVVEADRLAACPMLTFHLAGVVQLVSVLSRSVVLVKGRLTSEHQAFLDFVSTKARIVCEGYEGVKNKDRVLTVESIAETLNLMAPDLVRAWLYAEMDLAALFKAHTPVVTVPGLTQGIDFIPLFGGADEFAGVYNFGHVIESEAGFSIEAKRSIKAPLFDWLPQSVSSNRHLFKGKPAIWIVAAQENANLAAALAYHAAKDLGGGDVIVAVDTPDQCQNQTVVGDAKIHTVSLSSLSEDVLNRHASLVIDLSCKGKASASLVLLFAYLNAPIWAPGEVLAARGQKVAGLNLVQTLEDMGTVIKHPEARKAFEEVRFGGKRGTASMGVLYNALLETSGFLL